MASTINATAHGLSAGDPFRFANTLPTDSGIDEATTYYVLASNLTANSFEFSTTAGGTAFVLDHDIDSTDILDPDEWEAIDAVGGLTNPELPEDPLVGPTVTSDLQALIVRLKVALP
jgi:hypothetical protein